MKTTRKDGSHERSVLIGMIVDENVLSRISVKWERGLFASKWSSLIGNWCVKHYEKYKEPPGQRIEGIFSSWAETQKDTHTIELVEKFLETLSDEYEKGTGKSPEYLIDLASKLFNTNKLNSLVEKIQGDVDRGEVPDAMERVTTFNQVNVGAGTGIDVLQDMEAFREAYDRPSEIIVQYPGALGKFFGDELCRDGFIAFQGPEKRGKSFWLLDIAWRSMLQRRKVAYFVIGDMSQHQVLKRIGSRAAKHPYKIPGGFPGKIPHPEKMKKIPTEPVAMVKYKTLKFDKRMKWQDGWRAIKEVTTKTRSKKSLLKLSCHPSLSITVPEIEGILKNWERAGWGVPDVVVIDYADNLSTTSNQATDTRHQINTTWKQMRALSQSLHCLVITATQADINAQKVETQTRMNFSEDKRKYAEITGMIGINQTQEEKLKGLMRLNWLALRESDYYESKCVHVAGSLGVANPSIVSCF